MSEAGGPFDPRANAPSETGGGPATATSRPGEFEIIERYLAPLASDPGAAGLSDDAAVITAEPGTDLVVTKDALAADVHFFADDPPGSIASKVLRANLSDLAAKGATPAGYLMALALPSDWTADWLEAFVAGLADDQDRYGITLLGGDTLKASGGLTISITAFGRLPAGSIVRRSGAKPGDRVFVTGTIGDAALGLALRFEPGKASAWGLDDAMAAHLADRYLWPQPRTTAAAAVRRFASAALDVSDGLIGDLAHMASSSGVAARIGAADVPLSPAVAQASRIDPAAFEMALTGGDDFEILASVPEQSCDGFRDALTAIGVPVTEIGSIEAGEGIVVVGRDGQPMTLAGTSFSHF
ncbi:thiamine-phosphate kinase [Amorphus orientalis]|uniref:Thiamine-monophosphate kinase n=1 Tax=Amorphus orientalis TaxID=649198 RepID=A0AAE3VNT7_9HYPH|nr:thiamine-phosphate kinase [Amorphus orientalis]MDQ0316044.1 thiamine-monophosphate kinase [Amorphus orientalis]